jgi:hypothetical protein
MPLRDHFRPPLDKSRHWEGFYGGWPMMIAAALSKVLPRRYFAEPRVRLGVNAEVDVGTFDEDPTLPWRAVDDSEGGVATAIWAPPRPAVDVVVGIPLDDEYEVQIYDSERNGRLVASIEIVSPSNKDRPASRAVFAAKCVSLLRQNVSVAIVDVVSTRQLNLYSDLLDLIGISDPTMGDGPPRLYAVETRWKQIKGPSGRFQAWLNPLAVGQPLPTLPIWLSDDVAVRLELESSYEETCRVLRIL